MKANEQQILKSENNLNHHKSLAKINFEKRKENRLSIKYINTIAIFHYL